MKIEYYCAVCGKEVRVSQRRNFDVLCVECYKKYEPQMDEPWLKYLVKEENLRRQRVLYRVNHLSSEILFSDLSETEIERARPFFRPEFDN